VISASVLQRYSSRLSMEQVLREIETAASRIAELVSSIREYSYMDRAPVQEVDIHRGIESTLTILSHRFTDQLRITRKYDCTIPVITAHGGELNQVWTNLIENALDAMGGAGDLCVRTRREIDRALVEVIDSGPGIPPEIQDRIFEPFFSTKGSELGRGLGLDSVYRIVRNHRGDIRLDSKPGCTSFQVRLPLISPTPDGSSELPS